MNIYLNITIHRFKASRFQYFAVLSFPQHILQQLIKLNIAMSTNLKYNLVKHRMQAKIEKIINKHT